jgi:hypothetical protein
MIRISRTGGLFDVLLEERSMSRHLQYLNCLRAKLKARYGEDDDAVQEVERAVKALEEVEARHRASPVFGAVPPAASIGRNLVDTPIAAMSRPPVS